MRGLTGFVLMLFTGLAFLRCATGAAAQGTGTVSGIVEYADTGKAASGVRITLTNESIDTGLHVDPKTGEYLIRDVAEADKTLYTDVGADGIFTIHGVSPGTYLVRTLSREYVSPDDTVYLMSNETHMYAGQRVGEGALRVEVTVGHPQQRIAIRLKRGGVIEGVVHGAEGAVPAGETGREPRFGVGAERKLDSNHYGNVITLGKRIDEFGHYRLEGLGPGDYIVFGLRPSTMVGTIGGSLRGASGLVTYAPSTARPSEARVVHVSGAETHHLDVSLPQGAALHRVQGTVDISGDEVLGDTMVRLYPAGEGSSSAVTPIGPGKSFSFEDVPDGDYTVLVEFFGTQEFIRVDVAEGAIHMRIRKATYAATSENVRVAGHDVSGVVLQPQAIAPDISNQ